MPNLAPTLLNWLDEGRRFALATVVSTSGSAPRGPGSLMAVREDGLIAGSVSGGCVEGAVVAAGRRALEKDAGEMLEFGAESDAVLWSVGLSCGGTIRVWVEPVAESEAWRAYFEALGKGLEVARLSQMSPGKSGLAVFVEGRMVGDADLAAKFDWDAVRSGDADIFRETEIVGQPVFAAAHAASGRLIVIGAVHIAVSLVRLAAEFGMKTTVIDPRQAFAREDRFASPPDNLHCAWPKEVLPNLELDKDAYVVALTHDPKIDDPALEIALKSGAAYVGALGGSKTQVRRKESLLAMGVSQVEIARLHAPIGLDIGARSPEEIALSILAEMIKVRRSAL